MSSSDMQTHVVDYWTVEQLIIGQVRLVRSVVVGIFRRSTWGVRPKKLMKVYNLLLELWTSVADWNQNRFRNIVYCTLIHSLYVIDRWSTRIDIDDRLVIDNDRAMSNSVAAVLMSVCIVMTWHCPRKLHAFRKLKRIYSLAHLFLRSYSSPPFLLSWHVVAVILISH